MLSAILCLRPEPRANPLRQLKRRSASTPRLFGKHPSGSKIDPANLCVQAPNVVEIRLPSDLVEGCEFVTGGTLDVTTGGEGSVQLQLLTGRSEPLREVSPDLPVVVRDGSAARRRYETAFDVIRNVFPPALCYTKIVPVDEVITLTLFYREDDQLQRLMLNTAEAAELDRLWTELHFVSGDALMRVDAFQQILEYASQDGDPRVLEPLRKPINDRAIEFRRELLAAEPRHLDAVVALADRAFRRPLSSERGHRAPFALQEAAPRGHPSRRGHTTGAGTGTRVTRISLSDGKSVARARSRRPFRTLSWRAA